MRTLYVSDLDGTLLNRDSTLSPTSAEILNRLVAEGLLFSYATARSFSTASKVTENLQVNIPVILYNGGAIMESKTKKALHRVVFSAEESNYVKLKMLKHGLHPLVYSVENETERVSFDREQVTPGISAYLESRKGDYRLHPCDRARLYEHPLFYFTTIAPKADLEPIYLEIRDDPRFNVTLQKDIGDFWLEVMPKKATKAEAVLHLKKILHCDELVVFGDNINDIPMFQVADRSYSVENSVEKLKFMSTETIGNHNDDAVAKFIKMDFSR